MHSRIKKAGKNKMLNHRGVICLSYLRTSMRSRQLVSKTESSRLKYFMRLICSSSTHFQTISTAIER